jgi:transcriptional regulator with XRE-family HTH domain
MHEHEPVRKMLKWLREEAKLSQDELAQRLSFTASRISRLESGDTELTKEDAELISNQIGTDEARAFAQYLGRNWRVLERPTFKHPNREHLWKAEAALQRLQKLESDPELKNAFLQQIKSCRVALERAGSQLQSTEHPVALIGPPEVGKTTMICTLARLRQADGEENLNKQMALQTGGGRVTICEVHVRNGSDYSILVDPCSVEEVHQFVSEFCDDLLRNPDDGENQSPEVMGIPAEVERAIRNMSGLTVKRPKGPDGQTRRDDLAQDLAKAYPKKEDLLVQVLTRMDLPRRIKMSVTFPRESTLTGLDWVYKTSADINYGRHPDFSLPRRIEITVPNRILDTDDLDIRLIDTRGVDEPSAPRRDLQAYLDDERCVVVLCSKFGDAPTATTLSVIERAAEAGLKEALVDRGLLLVLPREKDDLNLRDSNTGDWVSTYDEGRDIKLDHINTTMLHRGCQNLPVRFVNVKIEEDCDNLRKTIIARIHGIRQRQESEIDVLVATIDRLIANRKTEEARAVFQAATKPIRIWLANSNQLTESKADAHASLVKDMARLRYVASLRASVNRRGNWHNFDYWHGLGFGTRSATVARTADQVKALKVLVESSLADGDFATTHDFLRHFLSEVEKAMTDLYQWAQALGEGAFQSQLGDDVKYWSDCRDRWGGGPGYRDTITGWTQDWFSEQSRQERRAFIDAALKKRWAEVLADLDIQLSSQEPGTTAGPAADSAAF